ncbi:peptidase dimerization domain-containing protein [Rhodococcus sp. IEGM 1366]|uniref:peptidase dimerization domain-containing protein n=1 Tax=Rhodococcus sp. IEGM 1366 TaxID=3082223 RepID=UPI00398A088B
MACLLGAAQLLADGSEHWNGTVIALFQPAEQVGDGRQSIERTVANGRCRSHPAYVARSDWVVGTRSGPVLSAPDSKRIIVHGRSGHRSMPQATVDPVVLAAMTVARFQTVISRETVPGEPGVLTVGRIVAGAKSNVIADHAVLELNVRTYSESTRTAILDAIDRIVTAECQASRSPKDPEFVLFDRFPLTDNDSDATERVAAAFARISLSASRCCRCRPRVRTSVTLRPLWVCRTCIGVWRHRS